MYDLPKLPAVHKKSIVLRTLNALKLFEVLNRAGNIGDVIATVRVDKLSL